MIIRYDIKSEQPLFLNKSQYTFFNDNIVDVGKKVLPINLQDVFNKGLKIIESKFFNHSLNCHNYCIDNINNNIRNSNNILYNNLYNNCDKVELCSRAKGNLIDLHFFPVQFKGNKDNEYGYLLYNLRTSLTVMIEMESALQWLVGYNCNVQFIIESKDIELTLKNVANRLSHDKDLIFKAVNVIMNEYNNMDVKYIASKFQDYNWNIEHFIGTERWTKHLTGYERLERNQFMGVFLYGDNKEETWKAIKHKDNDELCLFVDNVHKMMLKRIQKSMNGKHNQFKNYLKELIGQWFDIDKYWDRFRTYLNRIDDSKLDARIGIEGCKLSCKDFFNNLGEYCYNINKEMPIKKELHEITKEIQQSLPGIDVQSTVEPQVMVPYINKEDNQEATITDNTWVVDWRNDNSIKIPDKNLSDEDFFKSLSN